MGQPFLAVDWGTTNLRAWVVGADGRPLRRRDLPLGVAKLAPGEARARFEAEIRPSLGADALPAILCGMIGSNLGWEPVPYLDCPVDLSAVAAALKTVESSGAPVRIVPGLRCRRPDGGPDVMRGEEVHVLGWAAEDPARCSGERLICHPGTHAKWVRLVDGRIEAFVTAMTGELFDVLRKHSVLRGEDAEHDETAFLEGVTAAGDGGALASRLFTTRSRVVGGDLSPALAKSYLSGLLIGAEAAGVPGLLGVAPGAQVAVIGDLGLAAKYRVGLQAHGYGVEVFDGDEAVLAGLRALMDRSAG